MQFPFLENLVPKLVVIYKKVLGCKKARIYSTYMQSLVTIRSRQKFLSLCLSVWVTRLDLNLNTGLRRAHTESYIAVIYWLILMQFSHF